MPALSYAQITSFDTKAPHAVIIDYETGLVLYEKNAREAIAPASMTKIMTADLVFERIKTGQLALTDKFKVSEDAWRRGGVKSGSSTMFLNVGSTVSVEDLLRGVIIQSGNDACIVLAQGIAGSESVFAEKMTERAKAIGLESANFVNATGWPHPDHKISTIDLARLASHSIKSFPDLYGIYAEESYKWNNITQRNRNPLLREIFGADGLKTGHTEASGYGFVGTAKRDGVRRIIVINGLDSKAARRDSARSLMESAFSEFEIVSVRKSQDIIKTIDVYLGDLKTVNAVLPLDINVGVSKHERNDIKLEVSHAQNLVAPIEKGQEIAMLKIIVPGQDIQSVPLVAADAVSAQKGLSRVFSVLKRKIKGQ
ncbi:MAG: D-alanyl-D-alanine carboxypeptidase family protein [Maricaulaceae bacterium]